MVVSLRYCSKSLKDLCPDFENRNGKTVRFFVPTRDYMMHDYYAYVEIDKDIMQQLCTQTSEETIINLLDVATILHIEQGLFPAPDRVREIEVFFSMKPSEMMHMHYQNHAQKLERIGA